MQDQRQPHLVVLKPSYAGWRCKCPNVIKAGRLLVDLAAASSMAIKERKKELRLPFGRVH
eukprot:1158359-Pelagomonas_calceolata.AAC.15